MPALAVAANLTAVAGATATAGATWTAAPRALAAVDLRTARGLTVLAACAVALAVGFGAGLLLTALVRRLARRMDLTVRGGRTWRSPAVALCLVVAVRIPLAATANPTAAGPDRTWAGTVVDLIDLGLIVVVGWWLVDLALVLEQVALAKRPVSGADDRQARHARTKITMLRRMGTVLIVIVVLGALLWSIPAVREIGLGILASAGVIGIVAGLAAQTSLANLFAGVQIAFTDGIRIDDIVVIEEEWGRIEEITLTYVVVRLWDGTSMILPSTYFMTTPFRNWTHQDSASTSVVELNTAWQVPLDELRRELRRVLEASDNWDGRQGELLVDDATGANLTLIAVASAADGDAVMALRWEVREALVTYLQRHHPDTLPWHE